MKFAACLPNELARVAALHALDVLDSPAEAQFEALVRSAALVCGAPISMINLIDTQRIWVKASVGIPGVTEAPRDTSFCSHAILDTGLFEIGDALLDERFHDNPAVTGEPQVRFYAGVPIRLSDGNQVGTLCVAAFEPGSLDTRQREILACLASTAAALLEARHACRFLKETVATKQANENQLRHLYEATPAMLHATDMQGRLTMVSDVWCEKLGYQREDVIGRLLTDFMTVASRQNVLSVLRPALLEFGKRDHVSYRMCTKTGIVINALTSTRIDHDANGQAVRILDVMEDVTLRKQQEEALRKSESFLARTGALAGIGGWEFDIASGEIIWSKETRLIHGVDAGFHPSFEQALEFYAPAARPILQAAIQNCIANGEAWDLELPFVQLDGTPIWVRVVGSAEYQDGKPARVTGAFQNVTDKVTQRVALESAQRRFALAADSGGIGIWDMNLVTGELLWDAWNYRLYGLEPCSDIGDFDLWARHVHPEDFAAAKQAFDDAIVGLKSFDHEFRVVWSDGSVHYLRGAGRVNHDADGRAIGMVGANWDVTVARQMANELARQHELLRVTLQSIGDAVITTDEGGRVVWLNPVAERMTGWATEEAKDRPLRKVFHSINQQTRAHSENPVTLCLEQGGVTGLSNHTLLISRNGTEYGIEDSAAPIRNAQGQVLGAVLVFRDVTDQRRISSEMNFRATHDALTGLVNRTEFEAHLSRLLHAAQDDHGQHALLYIDLDQFKLVNDACGHAVGDELLALIAKLLAETVRTRDTVARLGGDEFAIILEQCTATQAQLIAQEICDRMEDFRFTHGERRFRIGASIGMVPVDQRWRSTEAIMQAADTSCYAAKDAGRNRVHAWFDTDLAMRARHGEMQWTTRIEQALDEGKFVLFAQRIQPIQGAQNEPAEPIHAEVLLRMCADDGSLVPPGAFLPAAERFHLASRIDRWVLRRALMWMISLTSIEKIANLSVNLSGQSVGDRAFHHWLIELLKDAGAAICTRLCLEITETSAVTNLADAALFIEQVRALGVRVALDDFGAGASSFGYLKTMPVDYIKIDGQFVRDVLVDPLDEAAVRCFADVAQVLGVKTVAEFVDQQVVLDRLRVMGIDYAQGYLLHRPAPIDELMM